MISHKYQPSIGSFESNVISETGLGIGRIPLDIVGRPSFKPKRRLSNRETLIEFSFLKEMNPLMNSTRRNDAPRISVAKSGSLGSQDLSLPICDFLEQGRFDLAGGQRADGVKDN